MKVYIKTLIIFIVVFIVGILFRNYFKQWLTEPYLGIIFHSFLLLSFGTLIFFSFKNKLFEFNKPQPHYWILLLILIILFGTNNYFQVLYSESQYYSETIKSALGIYIIKYIISSTSEEIIYRGFIQSFINANNASSSSKISKGNLFATTLFFLTHLGFFTVMDTLFAITSLINVLVYSLIVGYLFDKTKNILVPIILHIMINMLHIIIQINF